MTLRAQSWVATVLLLGGIAGIVGAARVRSGAMGLASLAGVIAGFVLFVLVLRNAARTIRGYGDRTNDMLREIARAAEEKRKP